MLNGKINGKIALVVIAVIVVITIGLYLFIYHSNFSIKDNKQEAAKELVSSEAEIDKSSSLNCDDMLINPYVQTSGDTADSLNPEDMREVKIFFSNNSEYNHLADIFKNENIPVFTKEVDFIVIIWNKNVIDSLVSEINKQGFKTGEVEEKDLRKRIIKGKARSNCSHSKALEIISDFWPDSYTSPFIIGRAYDYEIDILRNAGIEIEIIEEDPRNKPRVDPNNPNYIIGY